MKKLLFAQSRFVFFAGGPEGPKPTAELAELSKRAESGLNVSKDDIVAASKKGMDIARSIDDPEARVAAQESVKRLENQLKQVAEAATKGLVGDVARASTDELQALNQDISEEDVKVLVEVRQSAYDVESSLAATLQGLNGYNWADEDLKADIKVLADSITQTNFSPDLTGQELNSWAVKTESYLKSIDEGGSRYSEAFSENARRNEIREEKVTAVSVIADLQQNVNYVPTTEISIDPSIKALYDQLGAAKSNLESVAEPATGSSVSDWESFSASIKEETRNAQHLYMESINEVDRNAMEMQIQNALHDEVVNTKTNSMKAIDDAIKAAKKENPKSNASDYLVKSAVKAQEAILGAAKDIGEPELGKTTQEQYIEATTTIRLALNDFKASQEVQKVADLGGEKLAKVYEKFRKGGFNSAQEFQEAYAAAKSDTVFESSEFKAPTRIEAARLAELKQVADALENRAMLALVIKDGSKALSQVKEAGDALAGSLGNMFKKGAELAGNAAGVAKEAVGKYADAAVAKSAHRKKAKSGGDFIDTVHVDLGKKPTAKVKPLDLGVDPSEIATDDSLQ